MARLELKDLKDIAKDVDLQDLVGTLTGRADSALSGGRSRARRALGAHDDGALFGAFGAGMLVGAIVGALVALLVTPLSGADARRKLAEKVDRAREQGSEDIRWDAPTTGNGRASYQPATSFGAAPDR